MKLRCLSESVDDLREQLLAEFPELETLWLAEHDHAIRLSEIEIRRDSRNRGVGSKVLERIKDYARSVGKPIVLSAQPGPRKKVPLNRFYQRSGFKRPGRKKDFRLPMHTHIWRE